MFAWVRLVNGVWWPGVIDPEDPMFMQMPNLRIIKLNQIKNQQMRIPIDLSQEDSVNLCTQTEMSAKEVFFSLHSHNQVLPDDQCFSEADFSQAVKELSAQLGLKPEAMAETQETETPQQLVKTTKRTTAISWDNYFMAVAFLSAMRSKDPSTQVGACIVDPRKRVVGIGYNGFPTGCSDDILPWARTADDELDTKYPYVVHAEVNAILNKISAELVSCSIYVALFPCNECAKTIIQSGIKEVVYLSDKYAHTNSMKASRTLFEMAGVHLRQYSPQSNSVVVNFGSINNKK